MSPRSQAGVSAYARLKDRAGLNRCVYGVLEGIVGIRSRIFSRRQQFNVVFLDLLDTQTARIRLEIASTTSPQGEFEEHHPCSL